MLSRKASVDAVRRIIVALDLSEMQNGYAVKVDGSGTVKDGKIQGQMVELVALLNGAHIIRHRVSLVKTSYEINIAAALAYGGVGVTFYLLCGDKKTVAYVIVAVKPIGFVIYIEHTYDLELAVPGYHGVGVCRCGRMGGGEQLKKQRKADRKHEN